MDCFCNICLTLYIYLTTLIFQYSKQYHCIMSDQTEAIDRTVKRKRENSKRTARLYILKELTAKLIDSDQKMSFLEGILLEKTTAKAKGSVNNQQFPTGIIKRLQRIRRLRRYINDKNFKKYILEEETFKEDILTIFLNYQMDYDKIIRIRREAKLDREHSKALVLNSIISYESKFHQKWSPNQSQPE